MTQDEIIAMAIVAYDRCSHIPNLKIPKEFIDCFAKLVAAHPQPTEERNFCSRCGKRTNDIHTCTPPKANHIEQHLEMVEQEPVAWMDRDGDLYANEPKKNWCPPHYPLYTHPQPKREWVGLTYQKRCEMWDEIVKYSPSEVRIHDFAKDIENKLKELNT